MFGWKRKFLEQQKKISESKPPEYRPVEMVALVDLYLAGKVIRAGDVVLSNQPHFLNATWAFTTKEE